MKCSSLIGFRGEWGASPVYRFRHPSGPPLHKALLLQGEGNELAFHSILKPEIFRGFGSVFMAAANYEDTAIYRPWVEQGVHFVPDKEFASRLR